MGFDDKSYPGVYSRGVISSKVHKSEAQKHSKDFI